VTNAIYAALIRVTDVNGNTASNAVSFDTILPALTFEAEDFDYAGGSFVANGLPNAYKSLSGISGIDYSNGIPGQGGASYRPQGLETEGASDKARVAYNGVQDYDIGFANTGNWGDYTRAIPAGVYNIYMRAASPSGPTTDSASMALVTSGQGTTNQTISRLGTFSIPNTGGYQTYAWVPLKDTGGNLVKLPGGATETLRATTDKGGYNVNFYLLVATNLQSALVGAPGAPAGVEATGRDGQVILNWAATLNATGYKVKRAASAQGIFSVIGTSKGTGFTNTGLANGTAYYFAVSATNAVGDGGDSAAVVGRPTSLAAPKLNFGIAAGQVQFGWGVDHTGWRLEAQTNGLGTNWVAMAGSDSTNQVVLPMSAVAGAVFFRLVYP
jgi:hypothetical protein